MSHYVPQYEVQEQNEARKDGVHLRQNHRALGLNDQNVVIRELPPRSPSSQQTRTQNFTIHDGPSQDPMLPSAVSPESSAQSLTASSKPSPAQHSSQPWPAQDAEQIPLLPIRSSSKQTSQTLQNESVKADGSINAHAPSIPDQKALWLPKILRWYLIWIPVALAFGLALTCGLCSWASRNNQGLSSETSAVFGWRYMPTFLAVIYTQCTSILLNEVTRTEPFARLARGAAPKATFTLLELQRPWWTTLVQGFEKKRNGGRRNWLVILTCMANILAFLFIAPLSSALLGVEDRGRTTRHEIMRLTPSDSYATTSLVDRDTYFRAMASVLRNVTTSPWVTDKYFISPFLPIGTGKSEWAPISSIAQAWETRTDIFQNDFQCQKMQLAKTNAYEKVYLDESSNGTLVRNTDLVGSVLFESEDGCQYNVSGTTSTLSGLTEFGYAGWLPVDRFVQRFSFSEYVNTTFSNCPRNEIIIQSGKWMNNDSSIAPFFDKINVTAWSCSSNHFVATIPVRLTLSTAETIVSFDEQEFKHSKTRVPTSTFNESRLFEKYIDPSWFSYVLSPNAFRSDGSNGTFAGAGALLASRYSFNVSEMVDDASLPEKAAHIRRQFFGEMLRSSYSIAPDAVEKQPVLAIQSVIERRVAVSNGVAYVICTLLVMSGIMLLASVWLSRLRQRPLNLAHDPGTVLGVAALVATQPWALNLFRGLYQSDRSILKIALKDQVYVSYPGALRRVEEETNSAPPMTTKSATSTRQSTPYVSRKKTLLALASYIICLVAATAALYALSVSSRLTQALFTYRADISMLSNVGSFAPFSIIPTFCAVCLGLWWDAMDKSVRSLQPLVAMTQGHPTKVSRGVGTSYQSCYWLWASAKATRKRAWLLALVTLGSFLAQALIITMSALLVPGTAVEQQLITLLRTLELRRTAEIQTVNRTVKDGHIKYERGTLTFTDVLLKLFTDLSTNWMYTAVVQASLDGSEPAWSKDGWSFIPVNLSSALDPILAKGTERASEAKELESFSSSNITLRTPALRGRIECTPVANTSDYLTAFEREDFEDVVLTKNFSRLYLVPPEFTAEWNWQGCCANTTNSEQVKNYEMPVVIGTWNVGSDTGDMFGNFSIKWLRGTAGMASFWHGGRNGIDARPPKWLFFTKWPQIQALNCLPIIESAEAEIKIEGTSYVIQEYSIIEEHGSEDAAWSDTFVLHDPEDPKLNSDESGKVMVNVTTSYGVLFTQSLLRAASQRTLQKGVREPTRAPRDDHALEDQVFNIQNNDTGINLDFMSYASFLRANISADAFLDPDVLLSHSQASFSLFFQHFVSSQVSLLNGGLAYQPIGAQSPSLQSAQNVPTGHPMPNGLNYTGSPAQNTSRSAKATLSKHVDVLRINAVAFWLGISLLVWLAGTVGVILFVQARWVGRMLRNVECIADVLVLIAESHELLEVIRKQGVDSLLEEDSVHTQLGWFIDREGRKRWGIEVVNRGGTAESARKKIKGGYMPVRTAGAG